MSHHSTSNRRACPIHGPFSHPVALLTEWRRNCCDQCLRSRETEWLRQRKQELIGLFGGRCLCCGYNRHGCALHFHHVDPSQKSFNVSAKVGLKWTRLLAEAKKCVLVCSRCHDEIEGGVRECPPLPDYTHIQMEDTKHPGHGLHGEQIHGAKLRADDVREIRRIGYPIAQHVERYGVTSGLISAILRRACWKHI